MKKSPGKMQPCDSTRTRSPRLRPGRLVSAMWTQSCPVFGVNLLWTQTLLGQWGAKLFLALTLLFSIRRKTNLNGFQMKFQIQLMHFSLQWKTLVGFSSSYKTKLGQIILRKVVVAWDNTYRSQRTLLGSPL